MFKIQNAQILRNHLRALEGFLLQHQEHQLLGFMAASQSKQTAWKLDKNSKIIQTVNLNIQSTADLQTYT